jgi:ribosomal protein S18 acetylase RimI-like enzyme
MHVITQSHSMIQDLERVLVAHWSLYGLWPRGTLRQENGLLWYETPIGELPFNAVIRTRITGDADARIAERRRAYDARRVEFCWLVHPTAEPSDLAQRLAAHGLRPTETLTGMSLELDEWTTPPPSPGVAYEEVVDDAGLRDYEDLVLAYWGLPAAAREAVVALSRHWGPGRAPGRRWLARMDGKVVGKAYLSLADPCRVAAVYGMSVLPHARGRGVASGLTAAMVDQARALGASRVVLHSSEMAVGLYRRLGFVDRCQFTVFATTNLWGDSHDL